MHVTKVVDLFAMIPERLSLHFSDFSTIFKRIYKFAVFENKKKRKRDLASRPLERFGRLQIGPWPDLEQGRRRGAGFWGGNSPAAWGRWGKRKRASWRTPGWAWRGLGRREQARRRGTAGGGGSDQRWRRSGSREGRVRGRRAPVGGGDPVPGLRWGRREAGDGGSAARSGTAAAMAGAKRRSRQGSGGRA